MIRHDLEQNSFSVAAAPLPLPLQSNTYPPPYQAEATRLAVNHGQIGVHDSYAVAPGFASPMRADAGPTMILSVALMLTLLLSWTAYREVIRLRRVLGRYREYFKAAPVGIPVAMRRGANRAGR